VRLLLTGFGPFLDITRNPSEDLVGRMEARPPAGWQMETLVLPVSYAAAQEAASRVQGYDLVCALGVHGGDDLIRLETGASRRMSERPDVDGVVGDLSLFPCNTERMESLTFGAALTISHPRVISSTDCGGYLCNFWYYQCLARNPSSAFIHVAHSEISRPEGPFVPLVEQEEIVRLVLDQVRETL